MQPKDTTYSWSSAGYLLCSHMGCNKKARDVDVDHDCCGSSSHDLAVMSGDVVSRHGPDLLKGEGLRL